MSFPNFHNPSSYSDTILKGQIANQVNMQLHADPSDPKDISARLINPTGDGDQRIDIENDQKNPEGYQNIPLNERHIEPYSPLNVCVACFLSICVVVLILFFTMFLPLMGRG